MTTFLIITSGDKQHGLGHVKRQLVLAGELLSRGHSISFSVDGEAGRQAVLNWSNERPDWPISVNSGRPCPIAIIDIEQGPSKKTLQVMRPNYCRLINFGGVGFKLSDQPSINQLVDLQIYQSDSLNSGYVQSSNTLVGLDYLIIHPLYPKTGLLYHNNPDLHENNVSVIMGGSDPHNITKEVAERAAIVQKQGIQAVFGPAASPQILSQNIRPIFAPSHLLEVFFSSRMVISALGMTTYEAACFGLPTASVCWSPDHEETAVKLEQLGVTVNLGQWNNINWDKMDLFINQMRHKQNWQKMSDAGRKLIDGRGVQRVADKIEELL